MATLFRSDGWVKTAQGPAVPGAQIFVCTQPANAPTTLVPVGPTPLVSIYSDPNGLVPITQPIITDGFGHYDFYTLSGIYTVLVYLNGTLQQAYPDQSLGGIGTGGNTGLVAGSGIAIVGNVIESLLTAGSGISIVNNVISLSASGGSLTGSISSTHNSPAQTAVNLTTEGTYDWAIVSPTSIDGNDYPSNYFRWKANYGMLARNGIRKVTSSTNVSSTSAGGNSGGGWLLTASAGDEFADTLDNFSGHGIPESASSAYDGVADISGGGLTGFGFQLIADSTPQSRTINIYGGGRASIGSGTITITAHLTDGSAPDVVKTFNVNVTSTNMWFKTSFTFNSQVSCKLLINMIVATSVGGANMQVFFTGMTES